jgi:hypothetical protein
VRTSAEHPNPRRLQMKSSVVRSVSALFVVAAAPAAAQVPLTPRALGMGGAYVAVARGQEALFQNPANIALPNTPHWSFGIPTLSAGASVLGLGLGEAWDLRDYGGFSQEERDEVLDDIPSTGTELRGDIRAPLAAMTYRRFGLAASYNLTGYHTLDRDIVDLLLNDYQLGRVYEIRNTGGFRADYWDVQASYAHRFGPVALGVTAHYYMGGTMARLAVVDVDTIRPPATPDAEVTYAGLESEGGSGFGVDLGAAWQPRPEITVSASINNLNSFEWDTDELRLKDVVLNRSDYESGDLESVLTRFDESERDYDAATASDTVRALAADLDRETGIPTVLRAGVAWQVRPSTLVSAAYQGNLDDTRIGGLWERSLSVGWQQQVAFLGLRAGLASDLDDGSLLSGGITLGPLNLGLARLSDGEVEDRSRSGWIFTAGLSARSGSVMP